MKNLHYSPKEVDAFQRRLELYRPKKANLPEGMGGLVWGLICFGLAVLGFFGWSAWWWMRAPY